MKSRLSKNYENLQDALEHYINPLLLEEDIKNCITNLNNFKNLKALGFDCKKVALQAQNSKRMLSSRRPFQYNFAQVLTNYPNIVKKQQYVHILDHQVGVVLSAYPTFSLKLEKLFQKNFADAGFEVALCEFFIRQKIKILDIEFNHPRIKDRRLDIKIELKGRECFVEITSPISSIIRAIMMGREPSKVVRKVVNRKSKEQLAQLGRPTILAINYSDPAWSQNPFNQGEVSNQMFYSIKETKIEKGVGIPKEISLLLIKSGSTAFCKINETALYPLTQEEIQALRHIPFWKIVLYSLIGRS